MRVNGSIPTVVEYANVFADECAKQYPVIDEFEQRLGYALERDRLEHAAHTLACPVKVNPPNWQHGRVIYAAARRYLSNLEGRWLLDQFSAPPRLNFLDIGTAKGFSALMLALAFNDSKIQLHANVTTIDVVDPHARVRRNSIVEESGVRTVPEFLRDWPNELAIMRFVGSDASKWLSHRVSTRWNIAVVDGKHTLEAVNAELRCILPAQQPGDVIFFDDLQIPGVKMAVKRLKGYAVEYIHVLPHRAYALAVKS